MEENLVGYLLGALDSESHREVESYLNGNPEAQQRLDLLRRSLAPLESDRDTIAPPPGLALRTLAAIAEFRCRQLPAAPEPVVLSIAPPSRSWWRRADILVAAGLLLAVIGVGLPVVSDARHKKTLLECENNLRQIHQSLVSYANQHDGRFPKVEEHPPLNVAGVFVPILHDAGLLPADVRVHCPGATDTAPPRWTLEQLRNMPAAEFERRAPDLACGYAYTLGYRDATGRHHGQRLEPNEDGNGYTPIVADCPRIPQGEGATDRDNSPNHGGGQNVLFVNGNVRFCKHRNVGVGNDDIYHNRDRRVGAGLDRWDTVLGASADRP